VALFILNNMKPEERKALPVYTGVFKYFPDALLEVTKASLGGNKQHLNGQALHWDKTKSMDQLDALSRHLLDHARGEIYDSDGVMHLAKVCWRALAELQLYLELSPEEKETIWKRLNGDQ
jgi:hypothetical protein